MGGYGEKKRSVAVQVMQAASWETEDARRKTDGSVIYIKTKSNEAELKVLRNARLIDFVTGDDNKALKQMTKKRFLEKFIEKYAIFNQLYLDDLASQLVKLKTAPQVIDNLAIISRFTPSYTATILQNAYDALKTVGNMSPLFIVISDNLAMHSICFSKRLYDREIYRYTESVFSGHDIEHVSKAGKYVGRYIDKVADFIITAIADGQAVHLSNDRGN